MPELEAVVAADFDQMVELRIAALRESLERLGRFDSVRARERLAAGFCPEFMQHIVVDQERVGFITLRPAADVQAPSLRLDHLYIRPGGQGRGVGAWALAWAKQQAHAQHVGIVLSALKHSAANRFYVRHGFVVTGESEFDIDYRWSATATDGVAA